MSARSRIQWALLEQVEVSSWHGCFFRFSLCLYDICTCLDHALHRLSAVCQSHDGTEFNCTSVDSKQRELAIQLDLIEEVQHAVCHLACL